MKKLMIPLLLMCVLFCGCSEVAESIDVEAILTSVVESIDWEQLQSYAEKGANALVEKYACAMNAVFGEKATTVLSIRPEGVVCIR